jgi:hypothetical protein
MCAVPLCDCDKIGGADRMAEGTKKIFLEHPECYKRFPACPQCAPACEHYGDVDDQDASFMSGLRSAMSGCVFQDAEQTASLLDRVVPARCKRRPDAWPEKSRLCWFLAYWEHLADELWAYHRGDYKDFLNLRETGGKLLAEYACRSLSENLVAGYAQAARRLMSEPCRPTTNCLECPIPCAFGALVGRMAFRADLLASIKGCQGMPSQQLLDVAARKIAGYVFSTLPLPSEKETVQTLEGLAYCMTAHVTDGTIKAKHLQEELMSRVIPLLAKGAQS